MEARARSFDLDEQATQSPLTVKPDAKSPLSKSAGPPKANDIKKFAMDAVWKFVRHTYTGDKRRFITNDGKYDLDLTYITDRIIAMSFPATGVETAYRNHIDDVSNFLEEYHKDHYMIYNLSMRPYDELKFDCRVVNCGFPDHYAPPLAHLLRLCVHIDEYLAQDSSNVVVVHCLAGKGRTGVVAGAYFLYCHLFTNANEALRHFAHQRSNNNWGVTVPSQRRYTNYIGDIVHGSFQIDPNPLVLQEIIMKTTPAFDLEKEGILPMLEIYNVSLRGEKKALYIMDRNRLTYLVSSSTSITKFDLNIVVHGDILIYMKHMGVLRNVPILRLQFHTGMISNHLLYLKKSEIDEAFADKRFSEDFALELIFAPINDSNRATYESGIAANDYKDAKSRIWTNRSSVTDGTSCFFGDHNRKILKTKQLILPDASTFTERGGYLLKKGETLGGWKKRWFVLNSVSISYFKGPKSVTPICIIDLVGIIKINYKGKNVFQILIENRCFDIAAGDDQEAEEWVEAIEFARTIYEENSTNTDELANPNPEIYNSFVSTTPNSSPSPQILDFRSRRNRMSMIQPEEVTIEVIEVRTARKDKGQRQKTPPLQWQSDEEKKVEREDILLMEKDYFCKYQLLGKIVNTGSLRKHCTRKTLDCFSENEISSVNISLFEANIKEKEDPEASDFGEYVGTVTVDLKKVFLNNLLSATKWHKVVNIASAESPIEILVLIDFTSTKSEIQPVGSNEYDDDLPIVEELPREILEGLFANESVTSSQESFFPPFEESVTSSQETSFAQVQESIVHSQETSFVQVQESFAQVQESIAQVQESIVHSQETSFVQVQESIAQVQESIVSSQESTNT